MLSAQWRLSESCLNYLYNASHQANIENYIIAGDFNDNPRPSAPYDKKREPKVYSWTHFYNKEQWLMALFCRFSKVWKEVLPILDGNFFSRCFAAQFTLTSRKGLIFYRDLSKAVFLGTKRRSMIAGM